MSLSAWPPAWDHKIKRYLQLEGEQEAEKRGGKLWREALNLCQHRTWHQIISLEEFNGLFEPYAQASQAVQRLLVGSDRVVLMAVSLGAGVEEQSRELLARNEIFAGFLLDRMGSYLAEWCMSSLDRQITEDLGAQGVKTTRRYSPGYQDFSLQAQKVFVDLAAEARTGINLRPDYSLAPEKSVTALKGIVSGS
ncbi:MAG: hypothetical protein KQH53_14080 [Desulfarculaceae bacterium]|nr:hypothetical protein [Desulfarculaceae bacterium]